MMHLHQSFVTHEICFLKRFIRTNFINKTTKKFSDLIMITLDLIKVKVLDYYQQQKYIK